MSSFPNHVCNIKALSKMGFDMSEQLDEDGEVEYESWGYDEQVYMIQDIIHQLQEQNFKVKEIKQ